jgi:hypothetical protein
MAVTAVAWIVVVPFVAWAVIRLFGLDTGYPLEAMMPFTPYVAAASVVALALALRRRGPTAVAAVAAICLAAVVLPRQFGTDRRPCGRRQPRRRTTSGRTHDRGVHATVRA